MMHAFLLYFDVFFTVDGIPILPKQHVRVIKDEDAILAEVWRVGGDQKPRRSLSRSLSRRASEKQTADAEKQRKEKETMSFSTGPQSVPTHWKQTLFLLREPIMLEEGEFLLRNSRLNVIESRSLKRDNSFWNDFLPQE